MNINVITLFPDFLKAFKNFSIVKNADKKGLISLNIIDIRKFSKLKHNQVDDTPYGGGPGMVLMVEPIVKAIESVKTNNSVVILLTPQGKIWNQDLAAKILKSEFNKINNLIIICGHYEGFDERILNYIDLEISIGDYILTGGEVASMVIIESIIRLVPGVINKESLKNDSFMNGLLDYPTYTKPYCYDNNKVPDVLVSGNHKLINEWREYNALKNTFLKRNDLLKKHNLNTKQQEVLAKIIKETKNKRKKENV